MDTDETTARTPPYIAFKTLTNFLDRLHESGIPGRIDRSYWSKFLNGTIGPQFMSALRALDLIDDSSGPRPILERLADPRFRKGELSQVIQAAYAPILKLVPLQNATWGLLDDAFRQVYGIKGGTSRKVITFFLNALEYVGIAVSPHLNAGRKSPGPRRAIGRRKQTSQPPVTRTPVSVPLVASEVRLHKSVQGFIDDLPAIGTPWSEDSIDKWLASFSVILKHVYAREQ